MDNLQQQPMCFGLQTTDKNETLIHFDGIYIYYMIM